MLFNIYMEPLNEVLKSLSLQFHQYVVDIQLSRFTVGSQVAKERPWPVSGGSDELDDG